MPLIYISTYSLSLHLLCYLCPSEEARWDVEGDGNIGRDVNETAIASASDYPYNISEWESCQVTVELISKSPMSINDSLSLNKMCISLMLLIFFNDVSMYCVHPQGSREFLTFCRILASFPHFWDFCLPLFSECPLTHYSVPFSCCTAISQVLDQSCMSGKWPQEFWPQILIIPGLDSMKNTISDFWTVVPSLAYFEKLLC